MQLNVPVAWRFQTLDTLLLSTVSSARHSHLQKKYSVWGYKIKYLWTCLVVEMKKFLDGKFDFFVKWPRWILMRVLICWVFLGIVTILRNMSRVPDLTKKLFLRFKEFFWRTNCEKIYNFWWTFEVSHQKIY